MPRGAAEHQRVDGRVLRAGTARRSRPKRRLRLGDADLRAGELRREPGQEVKERLVAGRAARAAADPEGVRGEEPTIQRVAAGLAGSAWSIC